MEHCFSAQPGAEQENNKRDQRRRKSRIVKAALTEDEITQQFHYLEQFRALICRQHCTAVLNVTTHLQQHHATTSKDRRRIVQHFEGLQLSTPDEIIPPPPGRLPLKELGDSQNAFQCTHFDPITGDSCNKITINLEGLRMHCKNAHQIRWVGDTQKLYDKVRVQTFFRSGGFQRYFTVNESYQEASPDADTQQLRTLLDEWKGTQSTHEREMQVMDAEVAKQDKTGWFKRTGWPELFKDRNLYYLSHLIRLPQRQEEKLQLAAKAVELLVERSVAGLSTLARETRRWLRSAQREEVDQRPMARLQNPESQATYARYIVMFICFVLRLIEDDEKQQSDSENESESDPDTVSSSSASGTYNDKATANDAFKDARELFPWKGRQKECARGLWRLLDRADGNHLQEAVLELMESFIFITTGNDPFSSGLIIFTAVLGIDAEMNRLRTAKNYSYMLAGIVYCTRLLAVEAILPSQERETQGEEERELFLRRRKDFLADGTFSPMSEMLSLLAYGKFVALNAGNSGNALWSQDKKTFYLNGRPIVISRFQQMARDVMEKLENTFWEDLMWVGDISKRFIIPLKKIVDDVTFTRRGACFIDNPENKLGGGLEWMLQQIMRTSGGRKLRSRDGTSWNVKHVKKYIRDVDRFRELLLFATHLLMGQPARGTEITTVRYRNGVLQDRNLFVIDGVFTMVVRYHKSQSQWDKPKVVPRFAPERLGQVHTLYLAYLQRLYEYLTVQVLGGSFTDYTWADEHGPWATDRLTRIIRRETEAHLGTGLTTLDYRHTAVGIGRMAVGESFARGYQDEIGEIEEPEVEEDLLELQNSRTTFMGVNNYSVPVDIVKHLSVRSIEAFRPLSEMWHRFLGVDGTAFDVSRTRQLLPHKESTEMGTARLQNKRQCESSNVLAPAFKRVQEPDEYQESLYKAMQQALGTTIVEFRSSEQEQATRAVLQGQTPLVVVLPTGGGKTFVFMAAACMEDPGVTIFVVPFRALIENMVKRMSKAGIDCIEWKHGHVNPATVVIVSADTAVDAGFLSYAMLLNIKGMLRRVVIDEAHLTFTSSDWRTKLARLKDLRVLSCPFVLLTATLPPVLEEELGDSMCIRNATYIRASTVRPNIQYVVSWCKRGTERQTAIEICQRQQRRLVGGLKGVIYCNSKADCESIADELSLLYYHAGVVDRSERLEAWLKRGGLIVATSALGTGVDFPGIVFILHVGLPWSMIDYAQESGRGGRNGEVVSSIIVVEEGQVEQKMKQSGGNVDVLAMGLFVTSGGCRRGIMSKHLDGRAVCCNDIDSAGCDRCGDGLTEWQEKQVQAAEEWDAVKVMLDELTDNCPICWVMGDAEHQVIVGESHMHSMIRCRRRYEGLSQRELDLFRDKIWYSKGSHSCGKCGISQRYCKTGEDEKEDCQWANVVIPVVRGAVGVQEFVSIIREVGFSGALEGSFGEYGRWLGERHVRRVWGEFFSNAMVVLIRILLWVRRGRQEEEDFSSWEF